MTTAAPWPAFSDHALDVLAAADAARVRFGHAALEPEHLLAGMLAVTEGNAALMLRHLRVGAHELGQELDLVLRRTVPVAGGETLPLEGRSIPLGDSGAAVLHRAGEYAADSAVSTQHLLRAVQTYPSSAATLLRTFGVTPEEIDRRFVPETAATRDDERVIDLTERARRGLLPPLVDRPTLLRELSARLLGAAGRAVLLVGEPGVGKGSLVALLVRAIAGASPKSEVQSPKPDAAFPWTRLVRPGEMALIENPVGAIRAAVALLRGTDSGFQTPHSALRTCVLWVPDVSTYLAASRRTADLDAGVAMREVIAAGDVCVLGDSTPDAVRKLPPGDAALFDVMAVTEPSEAEVAAIVAAVAPGLAAAHGVAIAADATVAAAKLARRYGSFTGVALPGSAVRVLERACVEVRLAGSSSLGFEATAGDHTVDAADVAVAVSALTGVDAQQLGEADAQRLASMEEQLRRRVIGQDEALNALARAVRRARLGFKDPKRPVGSFLFLGGSGVGKTEAARALAEFLFGAEDAMVRLDMSEYQEKQAVARMIGAPPGYVGYEAGGGLTEAVRRQPQSLVLFDEVEKAHPDVLTILLQVLEDGRLTDGTGRTVDFRETVVILTSNVGTQLMRGVTGEIVGPVKESLEAELRRYFRVEFLNRLDKIIYFRFLAPEDLARILDLMLTKAVARAHDAGIALEVTAAARAWLLAQNHEPEFGARPLRRIVQDQIEDALVDRLLRGEADPSARVLVDAGADGLTFAG